MITSMMQGFKYMNRNIILSEQETIEFLFNPLEKKNGEGSIHVSPHEKKKSPKGFVFASIGPHSPHN